MHMAAKGQHTPIVEIIAAFSGAKSVFSSSSTTTMVFRFEDMFTLKQGQGYALANVQQEPASAWQRFLNGRVPQSTTQHTDLSTGKGVSLGSRRSSAGSRRPIVRGIYHHPAHTNRHMDTLWGLLHHLNQKTGRAWGFL